MARTPALIRQSLDKLHGSIGNADIIANRIRPAEILEQALEDAEYVQESVFEDVAIKQKVFAEVDAHIGTSALIGSSSSGIPASAFTEHVKCHGE